MPKDNPWVAMRSGNQLPRRPSKGLSPAEEQLLETNFFNMWEASTNPVSRRLAALHPKCPADMLERLSGDPDLDVRAAVAEHPSCPLSALERLLRDESSAVQHAAAANPSVPRHILAMWQLAHDLS